MSFDKSHCNPNCGLTPECINWKVCAYTDYPPDKILGLELTFVTYQTGAVLSISVDVNSVQCTP